MTTVSSTAMGNKAIISENISSSLPSTTLPSSSIRQYITRLPYATFILHYPDKYNDTTLFCAYNFHIQLLYIFCNTYQEIRYQTISNTPRTGDKNIENLL